MTADRVQQQPLLRRIALGLVCVATVGFAIQTVRLALFKSYHIDEFTYAHAAWLIAHGQLPYRDFFCHHFPLAFYLMALPFAFLNDNPENIFFLRLWMLPALLWICLAAGYVNARHDRMSGLLAPVLLLGVTPFVIHATEIRPDSLACALFISSIAALYPSRFDAKAARAFLAGALLTLSVWTSEKAFVYGLVFPAALLIDLTYNRKTRQGFLLAHPLLFLCGAAIVGALICLHLLLTHSWSAWVHWSIQWSAAYQEQYRGISWQQYFWRNFPTFWWLCPLAAMGLIQTARGGSRQTTPLLCNPDLLLMGSLATTIFSFTIQKAAYAYSLIPIIIMLAIFASRGLVAAVRYLTVTEYVSAKVILGWSFAFVVFFAWQRSDHSSRTLALFLLPAALPRLVWLVRGAAKSAHRLANVALLVAAVGLWLYFWEIYHVRLFPLAVLSLFAAFGANDILGFLSNSMSVSPTNKTVPLVLLLALIASQLGVAALRMERRLNSNNTYQHQILSELNVLTGPDDPIYDNSGGFVARPHVYWYYFTNRFIRRTRQKELLNEVPAAIAKTECTVCLYDVRFKSLPTQLHDFLKDSFHPYNPDIWIYGRRFTAQPDQVTRADFYAIRGAKYFIEPPAALRQGKMSIDNVPIDSPVFDLNKGIHQIQYDGPAAEFYILWLPRNGQPFRPNEQTRRPM